jgi:DNA-directed RNA polymerase specialized sigma subunit
MPETQYGVNSSSPASPGIGGAIKDAIGAIAKYVAPRSVKQPTQSRDEDNAINAESSGDEPTRLPGHEVDPDGS